MTTPAAIAAGLSAKGMAKCASKREARILALFAKRFPVSLTGADIFNERTMFSGAMYEALESLERCGLLQSEWEAPEPLPHRPRQMFYRLTPLGRAVAQALLEQKT